MAANTSDDRQRLFEQSVREIRRLRARLESIEQKSTEPIAIVGMACRMPGDVGSTEELWDFLRRGGDGITQIPPSRWDVERYYDPSPDTPGTMYTRRGGFLRDVDGFDAPFFGISPREADSLDPQQRLLLEVGWEALENAGQRPDTLAGTQTGVFVGVTTADYGQLQMQYRDPEDFDAYLVTSSASTFAAGRLSYWLGISGPSLSVDTACSSSLVSVHLACQSLRAGDCSMALAGGVNLLLAPEPFIMLSRAKMLSADGTCKTFDAAADGYARGEGCGVVVLKQLSDAVAHGDRVLALIRGSAVNQDGRSGGITVPSATAQRDVVRRALAAASLTPAEVGYVEAHGTGTRLGDPIEMRALADVLGRREDGSPLLVGSVKTNIGHLEAAAGVASLIKVVLSLQHGEIPPHLRLTEVNPEMPLDELGIEIPTQVTPWPTRPGPRVAGVSSFGASGTNAHVLVQEAPAAARGDAASEGAERPAHVLTFSAKTEEALRALAARYGERLVGEPPEALPSLCYTANVGRARFPHRAAIAGSVPRDLGKALTEFASGAAPKEVRTGHVRPGCRPKVAFLFTGQGAQYPRMAQAVYAVEPSFRKIIGQLDQAAAPLLGRTLLSILDPEQGDEELIHETRYAQPALFAVGYALAELWRSWGVEPGAVFGHSVGELAAACVAGVMDPTDGLRLAAHRGRLMHELSEPGAMASVFASVEDLEKAVSPLPPDAGIAAVNGPEHVVISGTEAAVGELCRILAAEGIRSKPLKVARAFHSPLIDPALDAFEQECAGIGYAAPRIPVISNITGEELRGGDTSYSAAYLRVHARQPVQFLAGMNTLFSAGYDTFIEVGPNPTLTSLAKRFAPARLPESGTAPFFAPSLRPGHGDWHTLADSLGAAETRGCGVDWARFDSGRQRGLADLPAYPFQRTRHWFRQPSRPAGTRSAAEQPGRSTPGTGREPRSLLGRRVASPLTVIQFESWLNPDEHACLGDCVIEGLPVVNVGVYLEAALAAARELGHQEPVTVEDCVILHSLALDEGKEIRAHTVIDAAADGQASFRYFAEHRDDSGEARWVAHSRARLRLEPRPGMPSVSLLPDAVSDRLSGELTGEEFYRQMWRRKIYLGPSARWIEHVWHGAGEAVARMRLSGTGETSSYLLHPGLTDAMFQLLFACLPPEVHATAFMLVSIDRFVFYGGGQAEPLFCHATLTQASGPGSMLVADVSLRDATGMLVAEADGAYLRRADRTMLTREAPAVTPAPQHAAASGPVTGELIPNGHVVPALADTGSRPEEAVLAAVAAALGAAPAALDADEPLQNLGLDSLMALEIKDTLSARLGIALPLTALLDGCSVTTLTETVRSLLGLPGEQAANGTAPAGGAQAEATSAPLVPDLAARYEPFPLSDLQQAYLVGRTDAFELGNVSTYFFIEVDLDMVDHARLLSSLRQMIGRHDMLRAVVSADGYQRVLAELPDYEIRTEDLSDSSEDARARRLSEIHLEMKNQVFDPAVWPLFDIRATRISERTTRLHVGLDALIIDAWSTSVLFREWAAAYRGESARLPELTLTYRDYALAIRSREGDEAHRRSAAYWRDRLATLPPAPELPLRRNPTTIGRPEFTHRSGRLPAADWARFKRHAAAVGVTPSVAICTAYAQVIAFWSKSGDFTLNALYFNRQPLHPGVGHVVGNFSATSLLEVHNPPGEKFTARAQRMQKQLWDDLEHSQMSGVSVLRELNRARGGHTRAAMPVVFASTVPFGAKQDSPAAGLAQHLLTMGKSGREASTSIRTPQVWLDHQVVEDQGELAVNWDVVEELFPDGMIDAMFTAYLTLLRTLCEEEDAWERPAGVLAPEEDLAVRRAVNATAWPGGGGLLHDGFAAQAAAAPDRVAVITPERTLTYREVDEMSARLDSYLRSRDIGPGALVGLVMEKGWEQVVAAIGVLKSGAAYVPIDATVPPARLSLLLRNSGISVVLTQSWVDARAEWPEGVERLSVDGDAARALPVASAPCPATPGDLAYVIYTSGSTGVPKGVMIEHGAAANTIRDINDRFAVTPDDRMLSLSAFNFDLSVYDVFGLLAAGGAVVMPDPAAHREPGQWACLVTEHRVTLWNSVPALMEMFAEYVRENGAPGPLAVRVVMMSGDWIPVTLPDRLRELVPDAAVWSLGGATEASIWSILYPITRVDPNWTSIPYGKPMRNQQFHVLNGALQPCPVWVPGQLYISGDGLARGYLNDEAKTRASFIRHPGTGERLYRTGDLGRYLPDGDIEFLGREDFQVKVNGYRVELGEIEAALLRCAGVRAAAAIASGDRQGAKRLVTYVVFEPGAEADPAALGEALRAELPAYLLPHRIITLDRLPVTANGKVDRSALPDPGAVAEDPSDAPPRDEMESSLLAIWEEFFAGSPIPIGVNSSFFDLGGDSLLAVRLMARVRQATGRSLPLATLFACPTIALLAEALRDSAVGGERAALVRVRPGGTEPPVLLVHPVGGDVLCYADLAAGLGDRRSVYGLQVPDTDPPLESVPELAAHYISALSSLPDACRYLGGWSMGGVVALEMARQLAQEGTDTGLLCLVDLVEPPHRGQAREIGDVELVGWLARDLAGLAKRRWALPAERLCGPGGKSHLEILHEEARAAGVLPADIDLQTLAGIYSRFARNARALASYEPVPYPGRVRFFRAADGGASAETARQWMELFTGDAEVIDVPGDHHTVVQQPHVSVLADHIGGLIDMVQSATQR
jgi:amino acid adenylation domain-containing protein